MTGYDNMAAYKETMDLMQAYHKDMDAMGLDAIMMHAAMHPAPVKVCFKYLYSKKGNVWVILQLIYNPCGQKKQLHNSKLWNFFVAW